MDFFTHLFLETSLLWALFGVSHLQQEFLSSNARKASFWLVILGTVAPDFDVLVVPAAHRVFTHSLVFPLIAIFVGVVLWATHRPRVTYTISWGIAFGLLAHLLLDLGGYPPMGLFWPVLPLCYSFQFAVVMGGGGLPHVQLLILVYTIPEWLATGGAAIESGLHTFAFGIPVLAFLLYLATVGRAFWPWWPCHARKKKTGPAKQGLRER